jgi:lipopolysaccharide biosynthesis regulator YciM
MQAIDLISLLLPVAAASGWYAAKKHYTRKYLTELANPMTQAYRRGINYLLDEKTDKAIAAVAHILEQDSEPLETHIALGNLFRRRGEVEKAIEMHKKLLQEPDLSVPQKEKANYELGIDYMRAGLFDRAEIIFNTLAQTNNHGKAALQQMLLIYQQQKDWHNAIACILKLRRIAKPRHGETAAHFLCELAEEAMTLHRLKDARDYLGQALKDDHDCVRASIAKGKLELGNGEYRQALETLRQVESQNPRYLPVVLPLIRQCWERQGNTQELTRYLHHLHEKFGFISAAVELAERIRDTQGIDAAIDYLLPILEANPNPFSISRAMALLAEDRSLGSNKMRRLCALLQATTADRLRFQCEHCGFSLSELFWRCPSCQHWGSILPTEIGSDSPVREGEIQLVN